MKRRNFFKNLGIATATAVIAPKIITEALSQEPVIIKPITKIPEVYKGNSPIIMKDSYSVTNSETFHHVQVKLHDEFKANVTKETFTIPNHVMRTGDVILIKDHNLNQFVVTNVINDDTFKAVPMRIGVEAKGEVIVIKISSTFRG